MKAEAIKTRLQSIFDDLDSRQNKAYVLLEPLEEGVDYEGMADIYERAFDKLDDAVTDALFVLNHVINTLEPTP